jgi:hypothetical protein
LDTRFPQTIHARKNPDRSKENSIPREIPVTIDALSEATARIPVFARSQYAKLWNDNLTLNADGSPGYVLHTQEKISNNISILKGDLQGRQLTR